jgi:hypothetical protein
VTQLNSDKMKQRMTRMTPPQEKQRVPIIPSQPGEPGRFYNRRTRRALARQQRKSP